MLHSRHAIYPRICLLPSRRDSSEARVLHPLCSSCVETRGHGLVPRGPSWVTGVRPSQDSSQFRASIHRSTVFETVNVRYKDVCPRYDMNRPRFSHYALVPLAVVVQASLLPGLDTRHACLCHCWCIIAGIVFVQAVFQCVTTQRSTKRIEGPAFSPSQRRVTM